MKWLAKPSGEGRLGPQAIYESPLAKSFSSYYYLGSMRKDHSRMLPRVSYSQDHSKKSHFTFSKTKPRKPLQKCQQSHNAFAQTQTNLSTLSTPKRYLPTKCLEPLPKFKHNTLHRLKPVIVNLWRPVGSGRSAHLQNHSPSEARTSHIKSTSDTYLS